MVWCYGHATHIKLYAIMPKAPGTLPGMQGQEKTVKHSNLELWNSPSPHLRRTATMHVFLL